MNDSRTQKVFALSFGRGLASLIALVAAVVMARILTQTELATYRQTLLAYDIAIPLLSLGLANGIYYFLPTETKRARGVVMDGLILMVGMGLLYTLFIALGGNHLLARRFTNPAIVDTLAYLIPLPLVMLPAGLLPAVLVVRNRVTQLTAYNVLTSLALSSGVIIVCLIWRSPESMVLTHVGIGILVGAIAIHLMLKAVPLDQGRPSWRGMKDMVTYSIPLVTATALGTISLQLDKLIVSVMCTPEEFAIYSNGAIELPLVGMLTGSIAAVIQPDLRRLVANGDVMAALTLFRTAALKSALILLPAMFFLLVSADAFILTLFSSKYQGSILPFQLYLLILPVRIVYFGAFLMAFGLTRAILARSFIGLCANLILSILLVFQFGYIGAIGGTLLSLYGVHSVLNFSILSRAIGCRWWDILPFGPLSRVGGISLLSALPLLILKPWTNIYPPLWALAINATLYALFLLISAWLFRVEPLQNEICQIATQIKKRLRS